MAKLEAGMHFRNKIARARTNSNRVIITVCVESPRKCTHQKTGDLTSEATRNPLFKRPQSRRKKGYDRRAELLAYSRELRDGVSLRQQERRPRRNSSRLKAEVNCWGLFDLIIRSGASKCIALKCASINRSWNGQVHQWGLKHQFRGFSDEMKGNVCMRKLNQSQKRIVEWPRNSIAERKRLPEATLPLLFV